MVLGGGGRALRSVSAVVLKAVAGIVALLVVGNLGILAASMWAKETTPSVAPESLPGVDNLQKVDDRVWRGAAPTTEGYRALAAADPQRWRVVDGSGTVEDVEALVWKTLDL